MYAILLTEIPQLELILGQAVSYCLKLICLKYYLPFDINPRFHVLPINKGII